MLLIVLRIALKIYVTIPGLVNNRFHVSDFDHRRIAFPVVKDTYTSSLTIWEAEFYSVPQP
jgi:hypothetical protein